MSASYRKIDYRLRPAKHVERKMIVEAAARLDSFASIESYRYVGFGSIYFSDFELVHKRLGIGDMLSIEKDTSSKNRFELNKPYGCIQMAYGDSSAVLPTINWTKRSIVWLDYDGKLDATVLTDIAIMIRSLQSGSMLLVSFSVHPDNKEVVEVEEPESASDESAEVVEKELGPREQFALRVGERNLPPGLVAKDFGSWNFSAVCRRVVVNQLEQSLSVRNGTLAKGTRIRAEQIFNFCYSDDAKMMTLGWVIHDEGQHRHFLQAGFDRLDFYKNGDASYFIEVPRLTPREIKHINTQLPGKSGGLEKATGIPSSDLERYEKIYRYFPNFGEFIDA